jgi:exodeoxyribonuclease VII small subunit
MISKPPTSFKDAYATLQAHALTLRDQDEPNIDDLLNIVQESVTAYSVCRQRIDAVEKALEETLRGVETNGDPAQATQGPGSASASTGRRATAGAGTDDPDALDDEDIPF